MWLGGVAQGVVGGGLCFFCVMRFTDPQPNFANSIRVLERK